jgi:nucleotide-binding universal stress UspA family protein
VKTILVPLTGYPNDVTALEAAYSVARRFEGSIDGLRVHPDPTQIVTQVAVQQFVSKLGNVELIHALQKEAETRDAAAAAAFEDFLKRHFDAGIARSASAGVKPSMQQIEGDPVGDTVAAARYYDLVVLARAPEDGQFSLDAVANILVGCGRPVLLAPKTPLSGVGSAIAIAWKETAEAARAVTASMPFLQRATRVVVLAATEKSEEAGQSKDSADRLASQLRRSGIHADARSVSKTESPVTETLLKAAHDSGADLLVMGAYSHSRVRELVFGGFTRDVLKACDLPVLMLH